MKYFLTAIIVICGLAFAWVNYSSARSGDDAAKPTYLGRVVDVLDGDSFMMKTQDGLQRVELHGIDAPEPGQPFGEMSTYYLADLIDGREVQVVQNASNEYGEIIGEVRIDGLSVNRLMLTEGYAWAKRGMFEDRSWTGLESVARSKRLGLWRSDNPVSPWDFRQNGKKG